MTYKTGDILVWPDDGSVVFLIINDKGHHWCIHGETVATKLGEVKKEPFGNSKYKKIGNILQGDINWSKFIK